MKSRGRLVREVYFELRRAHPGAATPAELLACAESLVELFFGDEDEPRYDLRSGRVPFERLELDVAFADGGWRVLAHEAGRGLEWQRDEAWEPMMNNALARLKMG